jgi:LysM repeat protein
MVISAPPATAPSVSSLPASAVTAANPAPHGWTTHTVKPGDTLIGIAARYRTTVGAIAARNDIRDRALIVAGTRLSVPRATAPTSSATGSTGARANTVHVVRPGDTLGGIAARYGTTLASLLKANRLSAHELIHPGQRIAVRDGAATASAARATATATSGGRTTAYRVRAGDTLGSIAIRHRTSVGAIAAASGISTRDLIHPGQRLKVPASAPKARSTPKLLDTFNGVTYPRAVAEAAARNRAILAKRSVPSRTETKAMIIATAHRHGVDPKLALAIAYQESGWNQRAVSPANAVGVMQVIPDAGRWASDLAGRRLDLLKTQDNITAGVVMLRALGRATGSREETAAAYYQGLGALRKNGMYTDTKQYVRTVMALRATM